jgi:hypothetical protein
LYGRRLKKPSVCPWVASRVGWWMRCRLGLCGVCGEDGMRQFAANTGGQTTY